MKAFKVTLENAKTYATEANAEKAVAKVFESTEFGGAADVWYFINRTADGRFFPVFIGQRALDCQAHLRGFTVVAA